MSSVPEQQPLLNPESSTNEQQPEMSHVQLASNVGRNTSALVTQVGLVISTVLILYIVWANPAGLFSYHPTLQIFAVLFLSQGILLLQPTAGPVNKKRGLDLHQSAQILGSLIGVAGVFIIYYNKKLHDAPHFTSWHGLCGIITVSLIAFQALLGLIIGRNPGQKLLGVQRAKSLWKWHRLSGYLILTFMYITVMLALSSADWVKQHSNWLQRDAAIAGLTVAWFTIMARLETSKMQFF